VPVKLALGEAHTCVLLQGGSVVCFGYGFYGALGTGSTQSLGDNETLSSVATIPLDGEAVDIAAGGNHSCVLLKELPDSSRGRVRCFGYGAEGQLGLVSPASVGATNLPLDVLPIDLGGEALSVTAGQGHSCALLRDGVNCWGRAGSGQLGRGNTLSVGLTLSPSAGGLAQLF